MELMNTHKLKHEANEVASKEKVGYKNVFEINSMKK